VTDLESDDEVSNKKLHMNRIKKRLEKVVGELKGYGIDPDALDKDDGSGLLKELDSDSSEGNVDELEGMSDTDYEKQVAKPLKRMDTLEEKKRNTNSRQSQVVNDFSNQDPEVLMKKRMDEYINAIEYLKKHNLSKDNKLILNILSRAEKIKKLQKHADDVEIIDIPAEVTPEDLIGITRENRIKKFQVLIQKITKTMNELKTIGGNNFKVFNATKNATAKDNYERSIALFKKQADLKKDFMALAKNRWQPIPELQSITEVFSDPKLLSGIDSAVGNVHIKLTIPENMQNVGKYYYKFKWMDEDTPLKKIKINNKGEEVEKDLAIDFGHHKRFANLKAVVKIRHWR
jgi:hypothetical protein